MRSTPTAARTPPRVIAGIWVWARDSKLQTEAMPRGRRRGGWGGEENVGGWREKVKGEESEREHGSAFVWAARARGEEEQMRAGWALEEYG